MILVLFFKSGIESMSFNVDRYSELTVMILHCQDCYETFDPCNVTARSGSHLVTSSFVRLQCVLLSVIYSRVNTVMFCCPPLP